MKPGQIGMAPSSTVVVQRGVQSYANLAQLGLFEHVRNTLTNNLISHKMPSIFLLCNFVQHRRANETWDQYRAKVTQSEVIEALSDLLCRIYPLGCHIQIGNAPLQNAEWDRIVADGQLTEMVDRLREKWPNCHFELCDLRQNVQEQSIVGAVSPVRNIDDPNGYILFDLKSDSLLDCQEQQDANYRVLQYPTNRISACHSRGKHIYYVSRRIIESDLVISIPKLKTHEKVGLTVCIKGCVGTVVHKDCLAHHRKGGADTKGDEYPGSAWFQKALSDFHDYAYAFPEKANRNASRVLYKLIEKLFRMAGILHGGSWAGNDTAWRMALDLARIVVHGNEDGSLSDVPVKSHFALVDGIIAGEGQGPLKPDPVSAGFLCWADDIAAADYVCARFMGAPVNRFKIISNSLRLDKLQISPLARFEDIRVLENGISMPVEPFVNTLTYVFKRPRGW